jgi:hypothetical protein
MPAVTELQDAEENVELAVLSAIEHRQHKDARLAERIASVALIASRGVDAKRSSFYFDLIEITLAKNASELFKAAMNSLGFEYQGDFARRYVAEGRAEGRAEIVLKLLALRFGPLSEPAMLRVKGAKDAQLDAVAERLLVAQTLEDALAPLS